MFFESMPNFLPAISLVQLGRAWPRDAGSLAIESRYACTIAVTALSTSSTWLLAEPLRQLLGRERQRPHPEPPVGQPGADPADGRPRTRRRRRRASRVRLRWRDDWLGQLGHRLRTRAERGPGGPIARDARAGAPLRARHPVGHRDRGRSLGRRRQHDQLRRAPRQDRLAALDPAEEQQAVHADAGRDGDPRPALRGRQPGFR